MSGKDSNPRPLSVTQEEYLKRWDMIFGRDQEEIITELVEPTKIVNKDKKDQTQE